MVFGLPRQPVFLSVRRLQLGAQKNGGRMIKVEILANIISEYGEFKPGRPGHPTIVGIPDEKRARAWIEAGLARQVKPQPEQNKMAAGPSENKEGKVSGAPTTGRSTASPSSSAPGPDLLSSVSPAATSPQAKSPRSRRGAQEEGGGESSS
jgi:hypothetical protein